LKWFEKSFGESYLRLYGHRDDDEARRALDSLFPEHALAGRKVLDLGCGPGRYLRILYERGAHAVGIDLSAPLLARAREVLEPLQRAPRLVRGDMRHLPFHSRSFDLTLCMFTTFGYFETREMHAELAREIARVTGVLLILDLPNPRWLADHLVPRSERVVEGMRVVDSRWLEEDPRRVCKDTEIRDLASDRLLDRFEERVHLFEAAEIEEYFSPVGLVVEDRRGDYDGTPFDAEESPRCLLRLRRRPGDV
jgi:SAM-dependent methyltransferase